MKSFISVSLAVLFGIVSATEVINHSTFLADVDVAAAAASNVTP